MSKRHIMVFLCAIALCSAFITNCLAEEIDNSAVTQRPTIAIDSVTAEPGEVVSVPITFTSAGQSVCGMTIRLTISSDLKLTGVQNGTAFLSMTFTKPGNYSTRTPVLLWDGKEATDAEGTVANLTFQVPDDVGSYEILAYCSDGDIIDGNLNNIPVVFISGGVTVASSTFEAPDPDLVLPSSLIAIQEEAFAGGRFACVLIPDNTVSIGVRAFANCMNLKHIYIPASVTSIANDAFDGVRGLVIHGSKGSYAETYAKEHNIAFAER